MNAAHDLERRLADYYAAEAPSRAPDRVLHSALATVDTTSQRHVRIAVPWRFRRMSAFSKVGLAAGAVIIAGAVGLAVLAPRDSLPGAGPVISVSPSPTPRPGEQTASPFEPPFTYVLPEGDVFEVGDRNETTFELRVPASFDAGRPKGVIVKAIGGGRVDPCSETSAPVAIADGPRSVIDYLRTVPDLAVSDDSTATVDELPAYQATVVADAEATECADDIWPWAAGPEAFTTIPRGTVLRLVAVDVAGEHVVITVYGEDTNQGWSTTADELIDSFRFAPAGTAPSTSPGGG